MADNDKVETAVTRDTGASMTMGPDGQGTITSRENNDRTQSVEVGGNKVQDEGRIIPDKKPGTEGDADAGEDKTGDDAGEADKEADAGEALPDFDPAKPEVLAAYDKRYLKPEDGALNLNAFSKEWWDNAKGDTSKGTLSEGAYNYLHSQFGLTKDEVKGFEAGELAKAQVGRQALHERAGGADAYNEAVEWGRSGGYSPEQKAAFNKAINGSNREAAADAVDLLIARHQKASKSGVRPSKQSTVNGKSGAGAGGAGGGDVYSTKQEWLDGRKEAGRDMAKQQAVQDKFFRSPNSGKW